MRPERVLLWCLVLVPWLAATGCARRAQAAPVTVASSAVAPAGWVSGVGYVEPLGETRRLAFKRPGIVAECPVCVGQWLKKDEVVLRLDDRAERAAVTEAQAALALARAERDQLAAGTNPAQIHAAEAVRDHARQVLARYEQLRRSDSIAVADYDAAAADFRRREAEVDALVHSTRAIDLAVAEARVRQADARLDSAREQLDETVLRAPFPGTILEILRQPGEPVYSAIPEPVVIFGDLARMRVRAEIDETSALQLRAGQGARVHPRGAAAPVLPGHVVLVKPLMGAKTVFAQTAQERRDLGIIQALVDLPHDVVWPAGLEVAVEIEITPPSSEAAALP